MKKSWMIAAGIVAALLLLAVVGVIMVASGLVIARSSSSPAQVTTDPQKLMIPRWFLSSLTVNGQAVELGEAQLTLQFEEGGAMNGQGGCNSFSGKYEANLNGEMHFGDIAATLMACDNMQIETAYFQGLNSVERFQTENIDGKLILSSTDGKTNLVFVKPPK